VKIPTVLLTFMLVPVPVVGQGLSTQLSNVDLSRITAATADAPPQRPASVGKADIENPCSFHGLAHNAWAEAGVFGHGVAAVPRNAIRPSNLKWELPIGASTGVLIAEGDQPLADRIQGRDIQHIARLWSNFGLGLVIGSGGLAYAAGCAEHRNHLRDTGLTVLDALAAAGVADLGLKLAFDRQFPYTPGSTGKFWGGGRSFPSGHAASGFAFAAAISHRYRDKRWLKWGAYGLATGLALSRYPAKRHYASDILVGSALGYVTGTYMSEH
jgi:membrane-associated phospholipid phosphatase